jgi:hypothetical protein
VTAASTLGFHAVLFSSADQLRIQLADLGLRSSQGRSGL